MSQGTDSPNSPRTGDKLPRRRLGRSELVVPGFALGGAPLGRTTVGDHEAIETIHYALEQGVNYLDTSAGYGGGLSETRFGLALEGVSRETFVLSTKMGSHPERRGDYSWDATMWSVEHSLRRLKMDYLDIVLVHDPFYHNPEGMKPVLAPRGALEALESLKEQGVIGAIGLAFYGEE